MNSSESAAGCILYKRAYAEGSLWQILKARPISLSPISKAAQADDSPGRSWMVPIITVLVLATTFCLYYFVYVGARREYLVNRNFRTLAALGDQLQRTLSVHGTILEFYSALAHKKTVSHFDRSKRRHI